MGTLHMLQAGHKELCHCPALRVSCIAWYQGAQIQSSSNVAWSFSAAAWLPVNSGLTIQQRECCCRDRVLGGFAISVEKYCGFKPWYFNKKSEWVRFQQPGITVTWGRSRLQEIDFLLC